MHYKLNG